MTTPAGHPPENEAAAPPADDVSTLLLRLQTLEDERLVLRTLYRYGPGLDYGCESAWLDCFTADGIFEVRYEDTTLRMAGHAALRRFAEQHTHAPEYRHKHLVLDPLIEVDGATARAESYFARLDRVDGRPVIRSFGRYLDRLVRCADGAWRFAERMAEVEASRTPAPAG